MNEIETTKQHMEALQALSHVTIQISEARETLANLEKNKEKFLEARAGDEVARINQVLADSKKLIDEIDANYGEITELATIVKETAASLVSVYDSFNQYVGWWEQYRAERERAIDERQKQVESLARQVGIDRTKLSNEQASMEQVKESLRNKEKQLNDDREQLERNIKQFKERKI